MPHIDDGLIHAWLDYDRSGLGRAEAAELESHLAECAECRARLAAEQQVRDRAADILAGAGPAAVVVPPFESLAARERGKERRSVRQTLVPLAWAASVAFALGLGWLSRELLQPEQVAFETVSVESAAPAPSSAPAPSLEARSAQVPAPPPERDVFLPEAARPPEVGVAASGAPLGALDSRDDVTANQPAADQTAGIGAIADASGAAVRETPPAPAPAAPPPPAASLARARAFSAPASASGEITTRSAAEARLGRRLVILADLPIARIEVQEDGGPLIVRVIHVLGDGTELILAQQVGDNTASTVAEAQSAVARATDARGDLQLSLEGPLPVEALQALLAQAR